MQNGERRTALLFALRNSLEHNPAVVYKTVFVGETIAAVEAAGWNCQAIDLDIDEVSLTDLVSAFNKLPEAILMWVEVHQAHLARQIARVAKRVSPDTKILVFGRAAAFIPQYFKRDPFDAVHVSGDREAVIADFLSSDLASGAPVPGAAVRSPETGEFVRGPAGRRLAARDWPLPAMHRLPLRKYMDFTEKVHGADYSKRVSVTVSKGCELACAYCSATHDEGSSDRRRDVEGLLDWMQEQHFEKQDCLVHLYAPDLFFDRAWIREFARAYGRRGCEFHWRGVTTTKAMLDRETVMIAGANGCRELAIGIEHIRSKSLTSVKSTIEEIETATAYAAEAGIVLKGLVMLGYPGQTQQDIEFVEELAQRLGLTIRYTGYTPLHVLKVKSAEELDAMDLESFDRRTFFDPKRTAIPRQFFFDRLTRDGGYYYPMAAE